ncbi:hypothetical protein LQW54_010776 [Pestalotiopsis sp. IQ-011]
MCRYLNTEIYCEGHGYLPVKTPQHELHPADEHVLTERLVLNRRSMIPCVHGNCFTYPGRKGVYGESKSDYFLRFRAGRCLSCKSKEAENLLRGRHSQTYREITLEELPPVGQPLSPNLHNRILKVLWDKQRTYLDVDFALPEMKLRPEDSLIRDVWQIIHRWETRPQGLLEVFVIKDKRIVFDGPEQERKNAQERALRGAQRRAQNASMTHRALFDKEN